MSASNEKAIENSCAHINTIKSRNHKIQGQFVVNGRAQQIWIFGANANSNIREKENSDI